MSATAFDTHKGAKTLTKVGFTEPQVEAQVEVLSEIADELATKKDLVALKSDFKKDMKNLKNELIITLGSICVIAIGVVATIVSLL